MATRKQGGYGKASRRDEHQTEDFALTRTAIAWALGMQRLAVVEVNTKKGMKR